MYSYIQIYIYIYKFLYKTKFTILAIFEGVTQWCSVHLCPSTTISTIHPLTLFIAPQ